MAAATNPASPSPFHFLKEGLLLPSHNRRLFAAIFAITVVSTTLFLVVSELGVEPLALEVRNAVTALRTTRPRSPDYARLLREIQDGARDLLLAVAAYHVSAVVASSTVRLVTLFAAVTTYSSGEQAHGFSALLGKASRAQLKGAARTLAFVCPLEIACVALLLALAALFVFLAFKRYYGLVLAVTSLALVAGYASYVYLSFVCSLGLAVAVAEPGGNLGSAGAVVGRAWRMMKGRRRRAVLLIAVTAVVAAVFRPLYWLARVFALWSMAMEALLLGALYTFLMAGVELFFVCALAAFYYECKGRDQADQELATQYVKLSIQDA